MYDQGKRAEATADFRKAVELDPKFALAHYNIGLALYDQGKREEATAEFRKAVELDPKLVQAHYNLGIALRDQGKREEATVEFRKAIELDPKLALAHRNLGGVLLDQGKSDEAASEFRKAIELDPKDASAHNTLGNIVRGQGKREEAAAEFRKAVELDPKLAIAHINLGSVLLDQTKLEQATVEFRKAIELDPKLAVVHSALGLALFQLGRYSEARQAFQRCLDLLPANDPMRKLVSKQLQTSERMLALDAKLAAILKGEAQAADPAEQVSLAELCLVKKHYADAARFYANAFAAKPALANDIQTGNRYNAACAAALAAAGQDEAADKPDDKERARLRRQAFGWLQADLALWSTQSENGTPDMRATMQKNLQHWQEDSDLAGVRDAAALEKLPETERAEWKKLWAEVEELLKKVELKK